MCTSQQRPWRSSYDFQTKKLLLSAVIAATANLALPRAGQAVDWDGSTDNEWTDPDNWDGGAEPNATETANFTNGLGATPGSITLSANRTVGRLSFGGGSNWTINNVGGGDLTLNGVGSEALRVTSGNGHNVAVDVILGADNLRFVIEDNRRALVSGVIDDGANSYNLVIEDLNNQNNDVFRLSGANTYDGDTTVIGGVELENNNAFSSGTVNWNNGVFDVFKLDSVNIANNIVLGAGFNPQVSRSGGATNTLSGDISGGDAGQQFNVNPGSGSTLVLSGNNTFLNEVFINQNTLQLDGSLSHANFTDDASSSTLTGTGAITWNVAGISADLMDLDESTIDITSLNLVLSGTPTLDTPLTIANYLTRTGLTFASVTNNTGIDFAIDYGGGTADSITIVFSSSATPEPSSVVLICLGATLGLASMRRRRA